MVVAFGAGRAGSRPGGSGCPRAGMVWQRWRLQQSEKAAAWGGSGRQQCQSAGPNVGEKGGHGCSKQQAKKGAVFISTPFLKKQLTKSSTTSEMQWCTWEEYTAGCLL